MYLNLHISSTNSRYILFQNSKQMVHSEETSNSVSLKSCFLLFKTCGLTPGNLPSLDPTPVQRDLLSVSSGLRGEGASLSPHLSIVLCSFVIATKGVCRRSKLKAAYHWDDGKFLFAYVIVTHPLHFPTNGFRFTLRASGSRVLLHIPPRSLAQCGQTVASAAQESRGCQSPAHVEENPRLLPGLRGQRFLNIVLA